MGPTRIDNIQSCGEDFLFCSLKQSKINSYSRYVKSQLFISYYSTQIFIIHHELEHLKMCLDTVTDMNETLNIVTGDNSDTVIDLEL